MIKAISTAPGLSKSHNLLVLSSDGSPNVDNDSENVRLKVLSNGEVRSDGAFLSGGADYAEMFEWQDDNPDGEDRAGCSVVLLENGQIRLATAKDAPESLFGVVSPHPAVLGDAQGLNWHNKYVCDPFGRRLSESAEVVSWTQRVRRKDKKSGEWVTALDEVAYFSDALPADVKVPKRARYQQVRREVINPNWQPDKAYTPRHQRKEWAAIGVLGKLRIKAGQPVHPSWRLIQGHTEAPMYWVVPVVVRLPVT